VYESNPIAELMALKHPEIIANAKDRDYEIAFP
jgi:hypothetical protein